MKALTEQECARLQWLPEQYDGARCALLDGQMVVVLPDDATAAAEAWAQQRVSQYQGLLVQQVAKQRMGGSTAEVMDALLADALSKGASDVHLEPGHKGVAVRFRLDGILVLHQLLTDTALADRVLSRIKVLAELDIAERRVPQDGRFQLDHDGRVIDCRVSIMPSEMGEGAVLRLLDRERWKTEGGALTLDSLGLSTQAQRIIRAAAQRPHGMLLVTGPTGSGKTTTLYATIEESLSGSEKVISIEDPVEYLIDGSLQIPVNEKKGLTFARGLRSILRHDPDKIMVGEIRDKDTAEISIQAALTGHLVFTTVHANGAFDVLARFQHMGIDSYSMVSALHTIVAQRLVRLLCQHCAKPLVFDPARVSLPAWLNPLAGNGDTWRQQVGCPHCHGSGYSGRRAIAECLVLDESLKLAILQGQAPSVLQAMAREKGMFTLQDEARELVEQGLTSIDEVYRVLGA